MILWEYLAPLILGVVLILTVGGVLILRPVAKHLGALLEAMTRERLDPRRTQELTHIREMLETMTQRLQLMEERQEFTDRLLERGSGEDVRLVEGPPSN